MNTQSMIRVTIPTYNCAAALDETVQSVLEQAYDKEHIAMLFVDFGSTDGTLEKILNYRREWAGFFSFTRTRLGRTIPAKALSMWGGQGVPGYSFLIRPGDVIHPHCFDTCVSWFKRADQQRQKISYIVTEVDIRKPDGTVQKQNPLFTKPCLLRGYSEDCFEYVKKGFRHAVMSFNRPYSTGKDKPSTLVNLDFWWNRFAYMGFEANVLYLPESLGCLCEPEPADELDDALFAFEQALTMFRMAGELPDSYIAHHDFEPACRKRLAEYILWRSFLLYGQGKGKEAEDCFLLARVVNPAIDKECCWQDLECLLEHGDVEASRRLDTFFSREEKPDIPKWPMGGMFTFLRQRWRRYCSQEKTSRFSHKY